MWINQLSTYYINLFLKLDLYAIFQIYLHCKKYTFAKDS